MATRTKVSARGQAEKKLRQASAGFEMAALLAYLANGVVSELGVAEVSKGSYRLEPSLTWKPGPSVLMASRGGQRTFRSVDTVV